MFDAIFERVYEGFQRLSQGFVKASTMEMSLEI